jgi:hypothetical protein
VLQVEITSSKIIIFFQFTKSKNFLLKIKESFKFISLSCLKSFDCCFVCFTFFRIFLYSILDIFENLFAKTSEELYHLFNLLKK